MSLRYKHVESALAEALEVKPDEMGAFRARLRHLRNLGSSKLPTPGSGRRIAYREDQVFTMLIALELEEVGSAPRSAAAIANSIVRVDGSLRNVLRSTDGADIRIVVTPTSERQWTELGPETTIDQFLAEKGLLGVSVLNLSQCARTLDRALRDAKAQ